MTSAIQKEIVLGDTDIPFVFPINRVKALGSDMPTMFSGLNLESGKYFWGYASVDITDSDGDKIELDALRKAAPSLIVAPYNKIFIGHEYRDIAIGKIIKTMVDDRGLIILAKLNEDHTRAEETWKSIQEEYLDGFSVGGSFKRVVSEYDENTGKYVTVVKEVVFREVSLTSIPANPAASVMGAFTKSRKLIEEIKMSEEEKIKNAEVTETPETSETPENNETPEETPENSEVEDGAEGEDVTKELKEENAALKKQVAELSEKLEGITKTLNEMNENFKKSLKNETKTVTPGQRKSQKADEEKYQNLESTNESGFMKFIRTGNSE